MHTVLCHILSTSQVKGVVLLEHTPSSQYLVEVQKWLTIELGLTCIPVKSPACAAEIIKPVVSYRRALFRAMDIVNIHNACKFTETNFMEQWSDARPAQYSQ